MTRTLIILSAVVLASFELSAHSHISPLDKAFKNFENDALVRSCHEQGLVEAKSLTQAYSPLIEQAIVDGTWDQQDFEAVGSPLNPLGSFIGCVLSGGSHR